MGSIDTVRKVARVLLLRDPVYPAHDVFESLERHTKDAPVESGGLIIKAGKHLLQLGYGKLASLSYREQGQRTGVEPTQSGLQRRGALENIQ